RASGAPWVVDRDGRAVTEAGGLRTGRGAGTSFPPSDTPRTAGPAPGGAIRPPGRVVTGGHARPPGPPRLTCAGRPRRVPPHDGAPRGWGSRSARRAGRAG